MANLDPALLQEFKDTITIRQVTVQNEYGQSTYDAGVQFKARWIDRPEMVYSREGELIRADGELWVAPQGGSLPNIQNDDTITLPDGSEPRILEIVVYDDGHDLDHVRVYYGRFSGPA